MYSVFFIIGASGAGKTTTLKHLEMAMPKGCILMHFDSIGVPSFQEMEEKYGSIEEWQRVKTDEWIRRLASCELVRTNVLFDAQVRPSFIQECCEKYEVPFEVVLFDASDEERKRRLLLRGQPELADQNMMGWASYLRSECEKHHYSRIDTTGKSIEETSKLFSEWLKSRLSQ